uniref:Sugar phosphate transporter domain-containing protein n=1 Tax=Leersia perrieri TaxID=77586 RepID=A0A0D9WD89_9ORYZ
MAESIAPISERLPSLLSPFSILFIHFNPSPTTREEETTFHIKNLVFASSPSLPPPIRKATTPQISLPPSRHCLCPDPRPPRPQPGASGGGADRKDSIFAAAEMGVGGEKFQLGTVGALSLSVVSSVSIVICNKALMSSLGFNFATTLTSWHLLVTFCSLHVALWMKFFEHKPFDSRTVMGFGVLNGISIGLLNLSLGFNSVGFYQMTKLAIIPCTVILETLFFRKKFSRTIQLSLSVLLFGVGVATVTDLQLNAVGSILSLLAIITTCIAQIMTNTIQKKFKVSSTQLLYQSCPYQSLTLFLIGPFLDGFLTNQNVFAFDYTSQVVFFIVLSCLISVSVNFSTFLVIGKTSPVTYQVLGHLKTCLVLTFGYVLLHDPFSWRNILGILIAVVGMVLYSYFCTVETQQKNADVSQQQAKEGDSAPLISDSLSKVENGSGVVDDEPLKVPMWSSKYSRA